MTGSSVTSSPNVVLVTATTVQLKRCDTNKGPMGSRHATYCRGATQSHIPRLLNNFYSCRSKRLPLRINFLVVGSVCAIPARNVNLVCSS
ncbi:hypothetical protein J6590_031858 [Homalodisca vitripennis]|nr:hypothetical protein J6590_031858 [Homalodisca vitripennis]